MRPLTPNNALQVTAGPLRAPAAPEQALGCCGTIVSRYAHFIWRSPTRWRQAKTKVEAKGKRCTHRPPVPLRVWNHPALFYAGMWKQREHGRITLKLWVGQTWRWVRFRLSGPELPADWTVNSPQVVGHGQQWWLHTPLEKAVPKVQKAEKQVKTNPSLRICAIDLNISHALAAVTIQLADGTVIASRLIKGGRELHDRRKRLLGRIARNRRLTGIIAQGEQDNAALWRKINALDEDEAHRVSRRIVEFARGYGATILVFEHLGNFKPTRGRYSKWANEKRSYWLRGRIFKYSRYKAWEYGIFTCRVIPRNTSRLCGGRVSREREEQATFPPLCGGWVFRYQEGQVPLTYQSGAPLVLCPVCGKKGQADFNATQVIGYKFFARYLAEKPQPDGSAIAVKAEDGGDLQDNFTQVKAVDGSGLPAQRSRHEVSTGLGTAPVATNGQVLATTVSFAQLRWEGSDHVADTLPEVYAGVPEESAGL